MSGRAITPKHLLKSLQSHIKGNVQWNEDTGLLRVAAGAAFLTAVLCIGLFVVFCTEWTQFGIYIIAVSVFHWLEFILQGIYHPEDLTFEAMLLDHSREYKIAIAASVTEYLLECMLFPSYKLTNVLWLLLGFVMFVAGQAVRSLAMVTAEANFTHKVASRKVDGHKLVTDGIYAYFRHPSYFGFAAFSIGTQIFLGNPICVILYIYANYQFFAERVEYEEANLTKFFGKEYVDYMARVPTYMPLIGGK